MKELNRFRQFLSENALGPDIEIMGQSFNFSDICPSAHKLVQNQAIVHQGFSRTAPTVLMFAILHRDFFALEKKALGAAGITVDEYKNDVTRLYTEILNVAEKLGVRKSAKKYMDMHLAKIKDAGFKASEDDGSSDRNFGSDEDEYAQDWKDEQDDMFGKSMGSLEEQLREVRSRIASEVEGYTDLHENDVALEAFLGESNAERNPLLGIKNMFQAIIPVKLDTDTLGSLGYAKATGLRGDLSAIEFFTENPDKYEKYTNLLNQANKFGVKVRPNTNVLDAYNIIADAAAQYELRENINEGSYEVFEAIFMKLPFALKIIGSLGFWGLVLAFFTADEWLGSAISFFRRKKAEKDGKATYIDYESGEEVEINENVFKKGIGSLKNLVKAVPAMMKMAKELKDTLIKAMELPGMQQAAEDFDFKKMLDIFNSKADPEDKERVETFKVKNGIRMGSNALQEGPYGSSQTGYQVQYRTMNNKVASFNSEVFADKNEALTFAKSKESDPSIMGVQVWEFYGPGEKRGDSQYLGGKKEISYYSHPAIRQKDGELSPEELDIKKFMGNPSHIHKRYGLSMDYDLMDTIKAMKAQRQEFLASSNEE